MSKKTKAERIEIAPNVFKASENSYYIRIADGTMKYCIKSRLDKLLERAGGSYEVLVKNYRVREKKFRPIPKAADGAVEVPAAE